MGRHSESRGHDAEFEQAEESAATSKDSILGKHQQIVMC